jgi:hypothetical protein
MDSDVYVLSDMTIEVHQFPAGSVIGFNGRVEWALDSLEESEALWVPAEHRTSQHPMHARTAPLTVALLIVGGIGLVLGGGAPGSFF